ncbi:type II toxin-antitoxin system RelE/ParE family toxin [Parabacteroides sp.]
MEEPLVIKWKRTARKRTRITYGWYKKEMGLRAAEKFIKGILDTIDLLALNPNMGYIEPETETCKRNYRSFVEHRNHKILYYVEKNTIYIADIWPNSQNPDNLKEQLK